MKLFLIPLLACLALPSAVNAHHTGGYKKYGFTLDYSKYPRKEKLTEAEHRALEALCIIGLDAEPPCKWCNDDINAAIASIKWGPIWKDGSQSTAYKTCNYGGYLTTKNGLEGRAINLVRIKYNSKLLKRLENTDANPSYQAQVKDKCNISVQAGTHQKNTFSVMEWFDVNVCTLNVDLIDLAKRGETDLN